MCLWWLWNNISTWSLLHSNYYFPPHVHVRKSQARNCNWKETNTPVATTGFTFTMGAGHYSSHTMQRGPTLWQSFFSSEWEFLVKLCFDRETGGPLARQGRSWFCVREFIVNCIYANPSSSSAQALTHGIQEEGESKATLKTLSKNGKALFNFTNKIILKSLCQLFACDLITAEYGTI